MAMQELLGGTVNGVIDSAARLNAFTGGALSNKDQREKFMAELKEKSRKDILTGGLHTPKSKKNKTTRKLDTPQSKKQEALQSSQMKQNEVKNNSWDIKRNDLSNAEYAPFPFAPTMGKKDAYSAYANLIYPKESSDLYTANDAKNAKELYDYLSQQSPAELADIEDMMRVYNDKSTLDIEHMLPVQGNENILVSSYLTDPDVRDVMRLVNRNPEAFLNSKFLNSNLPIKDFDKEDTNGGQTKKK